MPLDVKVPLHLPLSGKTMEFDATGKCTAGCCCNEWVNLPDSGILFIM